MSKNFGSDRKVRQSELRKQIVCKKMLCSCVILSNEFSWLILDIVKQYSKQVCQRHMELRLEQLALGNKADM